MATHLLAHKMRSGLLSIALEYCDTTVGFWKAYCNGWKVGHAVKRGLTKDRQILRLVSVGAGVLFPSPGGHDDKEVMYMRTSYEQVVGSRDSVLYHLINLGGSPFALAKHGKNEIDYGGEDASMSPRLQFQHQAAMHFTNSGIQTPSGMCGQAAVGLAARNGYSDQTKNSVFSNALSSPVRRSLQPYQLAQGGGYPNGGHGPRGHDIHSASHNRESNSTSSHDSSMDMHSDSPAHESY